MLARFMLLARVFSQIRSLLGRSGGGGGGVGGVLRGSAPEEMTSLELHLH